MQTCFIMFNYLLELKAWFIIDTILEIYKMDINQQIC